MSDKFDDAAASILSLTLEDVVEKNQLLSFRVISEKLEQLKQQYNKSDHPKTLQRIYMERYHRAHERKLEREAARADWCSRYLKVGDWVRVTGTGTSKYRKVVALQKDGFVNVQGDPLKDKVRHITTTTGYDKVTELLNPTTRIMEKIKYELVS